MMMDREVSGMMFSYISKSDYRDGRSSAPKKQSQNYPALENPNPKIIDLTQRSNEVRDDKLWRGFVAAEKRCTQVWEEKWRFLTEYDSKGNLLEKEEPPENQTRFSNGPVPNTNAGIYGSRVGTDNSQYLLQLEKMMAAPNRRRKIDPEMVNY